MKTEIKEKWLVALRSGDYQQGRSNLLCDGKYCCLGVLADLYAKENNIEWKGGEFAQVGNKSILESEAILPEQIQVWAGLENTNPAVESNEGYKRSLATLNDDGISFSEIANLIEEQL